MPLEVTPRCWYWAIRYHRNWFAAYFVRCVPCCCSISVKSTCKYDGGEHFVWARVCLQRFAVLLFRIILHLNRKYFMAPKREYISNWSISVECRCCSQPNSFGAMEQCCWCCLGCRLDCSTYVFYGRYVRLYKWWKFWYVIWIYVHAAYISYEYGYFMVASYAIRCAPVYHTVA